MVIIVSGLLAFLGYKIVTKTKHKNEIAKTLQTIPDFSFTDLNRAVFTKDSLKPHTATVFIYFNSECDYCRHEAQSIKENIGQFVNTQLLFVSPEPVEKIRAFAEIHELSAYNNIRFLRDKDHTFPAGFGAATIPYLLIYDKDRQLIKRHQGQLKAATILKIVQQ